MTTAERSGGVRRSRHAALRSSLVGADHSRRVLVEKGKWDGSVVARQRARLHLLEEGLLWYAEKGSIRHKLRSGRRKLLKADEMWLGLPTRWCVICSFVKEGRIERIKVHAALLPRVVEKRLVRWVDLDLDLHLDGDGIHLRDETQFHERASTLGYPSEVIAAAWHGVTWLAPRYTNGDWPFDGWLQAASEALDTRHRTLRRTGAER